MSKFSTLNFLINSYQAGKKEVELFQQLEEVSENDLLNLDQSEFEPSQNSINAILNFALQYDVLQSEQTGNIELNLN
ncbi:MAG: hypothetical protein JNK09_09775 [Prolixibacteraceae bacterium]|nr:hypothetical protein [Prolixibacteraceae bacterium]